MPLARLKDPCATFRRCGRLMRRRTKTSRSSIMGDGRPPDAEARIDARARRLVEAIRARTGGLGGVEDFLHAYALSTREGLALMVLAEALLRVPEPRRRPLDRGQARGRRLGASRGRRPRCWCRLRPGRSA